MPAHRPRKRPASGRRWGWALKLAERDPPPTRLSEPAQLGFEYVHTLAVYADERRKLAVSGRAPKRLDVEALARDERVSATTVYRLMRAARIELFGRDLSDSAIYYRLRRERDHGDPSARPCAEAGCKRRLPDHVTLRRRYCAFHLAPHARTRRYRERHAVPNPRARSSAR